MITRILHLLQYFERIVTQKTNAALKKLSSVENKINNYILNREMHLSERSIRSQKKIENTKEVIDSLYNLIAGAIGESAVIKEIEKLSDSFHLFNDFSVEFTPPIYDKNQDDWIYSIQVDHLLVCPAGIFILETKNWEDKSVTNIAYRSPIKQIMRSNYALFPLLNSKLRDNINLESHHWGDKKIPIKNIVVMTKKSQEKNLSM